MKLDQCHEDRPISMASFTNLLLCAPPSDAVVRYVARLAAAMGADLTLADVIEDLPPIARRLLPRSWDLPALVRAQKQAHLERSAALADRSGVRPETVLLTGSPIRALVREVRRSGHDLLAVGASPNGTVECVDTSATRLLRECPCPVLLVRPPRRQRVPRVLVSVDTAPWFATGTDSFAAKLLESGRFLAEKLEGELHVLHVWAPYGQQFLRGGVLVDAEVQQYVLRTREEARQELERMLAPFRAHVAPTGVHLVQGDPRSVISEFATRQRINLLVMGTVARSGVAARLIGNTAEAVLSQLPCSMLVVKPDPPAKSGHRTG